jgi:RNA polymerase sigma factor (sigma-70 family)
VNRKTLSQPDENSGKIPEVFTLRRNPVMISVGMENSQDSISEWLGRLKAGEMQAAQNLWDRYSHELLRIAKKRLGTSPRGVGDEEDVALSVFGSIFRGVADGRFHHISTRDELWWLLLTITKRKSIDHIRRETSQKRQPPSVQTDSPGAPGNGPVQISLNELVSSSPTPDFIVALEEQYARLLNMLRNDELREIAVLRIQGYNVAEIAEKLGIGQRAVERKLQLIRTKWKRELLEPEAEQ